MRLLAIDPGTNESAWVELYLPEKAATDALGIELPPIVSNKSIEPNEKLAETIRWWAGPGRDHKADHMAIEMVGHYGTGMAVGTSVFDTCVWIGRFIEAWNGPYTQMLRKTVCGQICGSARANDSNIRRALLDRFPATGGGKTPQVGIKAQPGPLFGFKEDLFSALAVGITWAERRADASPSQ